MHNDQASALSARQCERPPGGVARPQPTHFRDRHGRELVIRPIGHGDLARLRRFFGELSSESLYLRFFQAIPRVDERMLGTMADSDFARDVTLVAVPADDPEVLVAVGQCVRESEDSAEVAFAVDDSSHGSGIGTELLYRLADSARAAGIRTLTALVLSENAGMQSVVRDSGFPFSSVSDANTELFTMEISQPARPAWQGSTAQSGETCTAD